MTIDLSGKVILVTGATSGIGAEIARQLAMAGAVVAVHTHSRPEAGEKLAGELGNGSRCFQADLASEEECRRLFLAVREAFGRIHVLVNNAGVSEPDPVDTSDREWMASWQRTMAVNLDTPGLLSKMAINHFRESGGGRIVFISSRSAFRGETAEYLPYAASKGGLVSLSRSIARSFGREKIASFVVAPGFVRTPMIDSVISDWGEEKIVAETALGRMTLPADVAPLVVFLCSGLLDHCTGATFDVNAGSYMR